MRQVQREVFDAMRSVREWQLDIARELSEIRQKMSPAEFERLYLGKFTPECDGECVGSNGERRPCGNYQCGHQIT